MDWTVEALSVLVTGVLFASVVTVGLTPFASLNSMSYVIFGVGGAVFIGSAFVLARVQAVNYPPLMWLLPILPLLVLGVLGKDAVSARRAPAQPASVTAITHPDDERPLAVPAEAPASANQPRWDGKGSKSLSDA